MIRGFIFSVVFLFLNSVQAQYLKYSNEFLAVGVGARAAGMGNSVVSSVNDVTGAYWNPASLLNIEDKIQVSLMHNEQFAGIVKHDYAGVSFRADDKQVFAVTVIRMGVDDIPNTLNLFQNGQIDYSKLSSFSAVDYGFIGSYARDIGIPHLAIGANVKVIRRVIGSFASAWGFGFDLGAQYTLHKYKLGLTIKDATTTFNAWSFNFSPAEKLILSQTNNKIPANSLELTAPRTIFGISRQLSFMKDKLTILPELNMDVTFDGKRNVLISSKYINLDPRAGIEIGYQHLVFLRGGLMNIQKVLDIDGKSSYSVMASVGAGIKINRLTIDYALANPGGTSTVPHSNIISLKIAINKG